MDDFTHQHFNHSPLLGGGGGGDDPDTESWAFYRDPEAESIRSHPSSHTTADQSLLPSAPPPPSRPRPQPQRLQRRRNHQHYINGVLVPTSATDIRQNQNQNQNHHHHHHHHQLLIPRQREETTGFSISSRFHHDHHHHPDTTSSNHNNHLPPSAQTTSTTSFPHKRSKSYSASGGGISSSPFWLLSSASAFVTDSKRSSWTGERREIRKLQKEHPVGSARPSFSLELGEGDDDAGESKGAGSSVKRRMERLRGLYRKGDKEVVSGWSGRR